VDQNISVSFSRSEVLFVYVLRGTDSGETHSSIRAYVIQVKSPAVLLCFKLQKLIKEISYSRFVCVEHQVYLCKKACLYAYMERVEEVYILRCAWKGTSIWCQLIQNPVCSCEMVTFLLDAVLEFSCQINFASLSSVPRPFYPNTMPLIQPEVIMQFAPWQNIARVGSAL
jgi:hypothetical protein